MQQKYLRRKRQFIRSHRRNVRRLKILSRHPFAVPVVTFLLLVTIVGVAFVLVRQRTAPVGPISDTRVVIISYDKQQKVVPSRKQTVGSLLQKLDINVHPGDVVEPELSTKIVQDNFRINIYRAVPVQVVIDGSAPKFSFSAATTPRSIAAQTGVQIFPEDEVEATPVTNFLKQGSVGEQVVVNRSQPVNLNLYGTAAPTRTLAKTVGGLLKEKHVKLINGASVNPTPETTITPNMQVFVLAKGVSIVTQEETLPMPVQTIKDSKLTLGSRAIRQSGSNGRQLVTYQVRVDPKTGQ